MAVRTLIVLGSSLTALAVARAAHSSGLRCVMLDGTPGPAAVTRMAEFRRLQSQDMAGIAASVPDLLHRADVAVIADSDRWLRFVRKSRAELENAGWLVLHPGAAAIDICLDKSAFLRWCSANSLAAPRLHDAPSLEALDHTAYPLMLRPEWTQHSSATGLPKAVEVREPAELGYWLQRFAQAGVEPTVCQSLLRDGLRQFSIGAARDGAGRVRTFLAEKVRPHAEQCAGGTLVVPVSHPGIEELAARALHALDYFGVAEVEVLFDAQAGRAYLVEINARPWLQYGLPFISGCDLLGHALGQPAVTPTRSGGAHAWLYFSSDLYACFSRSTGLVSTGKISLAQYLRSIASADLYATWDRRDPVPWIASTYRTFAASLKGIFAAPNRPQQDDGPQ